MDRAGKAVKIAQLYRYLNTLKIKPAGARQRPQQYPEDSGTRILNHLGLVTFSQAGGMQFEAEQAARFPNVLPKAPKVVTLKQLKRGRK